MPEAIHPLVSIIIANYNGLIHLDSCFSTLTKSTYPNMEIIMVDNGSTDDSVVFVETNFPLVKIVKSPVNLSFSGGNNLGFREAKGKYLMMLNNDTAVEPGWLEPLVDELETHPDVAAVQPKVLMLTDKSRFEYAGASGGYMDRFGFPFMRGRIFDTVETDDGQYDDPADLGWTSGAAMAIRREVLDKAGDLDEDFVLHMEEIDLCWRFLLMGYRLRVRPDAVIYHFGGGTLGHEKMSKMFYNHRNSIFMMLKNASIGRLLWTLPIRMGLDMVLVIKSLISFDFKRMGAVFGAYGWLALHPLLVMKKRGAIQSLRKRSDRELDPIFYSGSIVFSYFLRRQQSFRDLAGMEELK